MFSWLICFCLHSLWRGLYRRQPWRECLVCLVPFQCFLQQEKQEVL